MSTHPDLPPLVDTCKAMTNEQKAIMAFHEMIQEFNQLPQNDAIECKRFAEQIIREAIQNFEQATGLRVDGIDCDRPSVFGYSSSPVTVKIRAILP